MSLNDGLKLAVKVLKKSLDKNKMNPENVEIYILEKKGDEKYKKFIKSKKNKKKKKKDNKKNENKKEKEKKKKKDF